MAKHIIEDGTIEACQRGESEAFRLLFESYKDRVYSIALCFFDGNETIAKDVTQDVFVKLLIQFCQTASSRAALSAGDWLFATEPLTSWALFMRSDDAPLFGEFSMLGDIGRRQADGNRDNSGASHDTTLQGLVANAGAFLYGQVVRSGKQNVWCFDRYQLQRRIGAVK